MSLAPIATTPQIYNVGDLVRLLSADLEARGVPCVFEIGEWDPETMRGEPRCMVLLGDGSLGEPAGHYQPGMWYPVPGSSGAKVAAPLLDDAQTYTLKIHAPAAPGIDSGAVAAQRATDQLKRQIAGAMRRIYASPLRAAMRVKWPKTIEGYPAFVYGSMCEMTLVIASPVLDDARDVATVAETESTSSFTFSDGSQTADANVDV